MHGFVCVCFCLQVYKTGPVCCVRGTGHLAWCCCHQPSNAAPSLRQHTVVVTLGVPCPTLCSKASSQAAMCVYA